MGQNYLITINLFTVCELHSPSVFWPTSLFGLLSSSVCFVTTLAAGLRNLFILFCQCGFSGCECGISGIDVRIFLLWCMGFLVLMCGSSFCGAWVFWCGFVVCRFSGIDVWIFLLWCMGFLVLMCESSGIDVGILWLWCVGFLVLMCESSGIDVWIFWYWCVNLMVVVCGFSGIDVWICWFKKSFKIHYKQF